MRRLKVALIGAGRRARTHLPVITALKDIFDLTAICDILPEVASKTAQKYGVRSYSDLRRMLREEELDLVDVVVPVSAHHVVSGVCMEEGVNVLCETMIAPTLMLADYMKKTAKKNDVKLEISENKIKMPNELIKQKVLDRGLVGQVIRTYVVNASGHPMTVLRWYSKGEAKSVISFTQKKDIPTVRDSKGRIQTSDNWDLAIVDFDNGVRGVYEYSNLVHGMGTLGRGRLEADGRGRLEIDGTKGTIYNNDLYLTSDKDRLRGGKATRFPIQRFSTKIDGAEILEKLEIDTDPKVIWDNPFSMHPLSSLGVSVAYKLMSIANAVVNDTEPEYGALQARKDVELQLAAKESASKGSIPISLPLTTETEEEKKIHENYLAQYGHGPLEIGELFQEMSSPSEAC